MIADEAPVTLYVSYREWFEIEYPDADGAPLSIADVQPLQFPDHVEACEFKLTHADDLTFYDADSAQVSAFRAYNQRCASASHI